MFFNIENKPLLFQPKKCMLRYCGRQMIYSRYSLANKQKKIYEQKTTPTQQICSNNKREYFKKHFINLFYCFTRFINYYSSLSFFKFLLKLFVVITVNTHNINSLHILNNYNQLLPIQNIAYKEKLQWKNYNFLKANQKITNKHNRDNNLYYFQHKHKLPDIIVQNRRRSIHSHLQDECDTNQFLSSKKLKIERFSNVTQNNSANTYYVYAITEDCQILFARIDQLNQLSRTIKVDQRYTHCRPELVQLHYRTWNANDEQKIALQLFVKRSSRQICTLPIEFPEANAFAGKGVFSYSLRASLNYAVCSFMPNDSFILDPNLSFMDSIYSDIVYFVDPNSVGNFWTVRQFKFDKNNYLKDLNTFKMKSVVKNELIEAKRLKPTDYLVSLDLQRRRIYFVEKTRRLTARKDERHAFSICAIDVLIQPSKSKFEHVKFFSNKILSSKELFDYTKTDARVLYPQIDSFSVDETIYMFCEIQTSESSFKAFSTQIYFAKTKRKSKQDNQLMFTTKVKCATKIPFRARFGFIGAKTLKQLNELQLPKFGNLDNFANTNSNKNLLKQTQNSINKSNYKLTDLAACGDTKNIEKNSIYSIHQKQNNKNNWGTINVATFEICLISIALSFLISF